MSAHSGQMNKVDEQQIRTFYGSLKNFDIIHYLGKGQFSVVYSARNRFTNQLVALKRIEIARMTDAKAIEDCKREILLLQQLDHPNVIKYIYHFFEDNDLYIVLEFVGAGDMTRMIENLRRNNQRLTEKSIWKFFSQICSGLEHMHSKRIMHRDIKPANIFINTDGSLRIGDLGLSRFFSSDTKSTHSLVGTPYYMAPERIDDQDRGYNFRSDIWSLGCILYELASFRSPFFEERLNLMGLRRKIQALDYPPLPASVFSAELRQLVVRCLALNPEDRPGISEVSQIARMMFEHFHKQQIVDNNKTPTPMSPENMAPPSGMATPVNQE